MKKPNIFKNENMKLIDHNKKYCYLEKEKEDEEVDEVLYEIFNSKGYSYNKPVIIKTKDKEINTHIIAKTKKEIITLEDEKINIKDIISIKKKKD